MNFKESNQNVDNQKKILIIILLIIAIVSIVAALILYFTDGNSGTDTVDETQVLKESDETSLEDETQGEEQGETTATTELDEEEQIEQLIADYRTAFASGDVEALKTIYNTDEVLNSEVITATAEIITGYENTECTIKDGMDDDSKVVFIYDELVIEGLDTLVPNVSYVYVMKDSAGSYYIYPGEYDASTGDYVYSSDIQKYITELISDKDISSLYSTVNDELSEVMTEDPEVQSFVESLLAENEEDSAEALESETEEETEESIEDETEESSEITESVSEEE